MSWWKGRFASDRWEIVEIQHGRYSGATGTGFTRFMLRNRYNRRIKAVDVKGEWEVENFPGRVFRGAQKFW